MEKMTDKEILATIYRWVQQANSRDENPDHTRQRLKDIQSFVEQEWQKEDDSQQQSKALGEFSKTWYKEDYPDGPITDGDKKLKEMLDVVDTERHRVLEIGEDGTVTRVK
tara:strand:+ start:461 stop:790 length:330 start_codon:yes stop_codon:yes gene_type:complete